MHLAVLTKEVVKYLNPKSGGTYLDGTLGGGGHAEKCKRQKAKCKIIGIDWDQEALEIAKKRLAKFKNITFVKDNFVNIKKIVKRKVDGIIFDLGLSSYQLGKAKRGFSFKKDGPLDMRMDKSQRLTAADVVNNYRQDELEKIFRKFGEERFAKRIAQAICGQRKIKTTFQLKEIVEGVIPIWRKRESVTRIFQALRIAVNKELENLKIVLKDAIPLLKKGGRIVIISYHSLEDRIVKHTFKEYAKEGIIKILTKKPITPDEKEVEVNPRARSAKLRAAERL